MITSSSRRDVLARKLAPMRDMIDGMERLDTETVLQSVGEDLRKAFSGPRMLPRLAMWRARKMAGPDLFAEPSDKDESIIVQGGSAFIEELSLAVGAHVLWQEIIRLVRRVDAEALDHALGIATRPIALQGREQNVGVDPEYAVAEDVDLAEWVRREGALGWACWLSAREPGSARRLRALTPGAVSDRVVGRLPQDLDQRFRRRLVVDTEIELVIASEAVETGNMEDA